MAKKKGRRTGGKTQVQGIWLWVVVIVVALGVLFMLARTLSSSVVEVPPTPILATANPDLTAITRMLGDIEQDTAGSAFLPEKVRSQSGRVDSIIGERDWPEAIKLLRKLLKETPSDRTDALSALHACLGFCYHQSSSPDRALNEFRRALDWAGPDAPEFRSRMAFYAGYLFQRRGFADSAEAYYVTARHLTSDPFNPLLPALLNNLGAAREALQDTSRALEYYIATARLIDTTADTRSARILKDNIRRLTR